MLTVLNGISLGCGKGASHAEWTGEIRQRPQLLIPSIRQLMRFLSSAGQPVTRGRITTGRVAGLSAYQDATGRTVERDGLAVRGGHAAAKVIQGTALHARLCCADDARFPDGITSCAVHQPLTGWDELCAFPQPSSPSGIVKIQMVETPRGQA